MKSLYIWLTILAISCNPQPSTNEDSNQNKLDIDAEFSWLEGTWIQYNTTKFQDSQSRYIETWNLTDSQWRGQARLHNSTDSSQIENMVIEGRNDTINFIAFYGDDAHETKFRISSYGNNFFFSENQAHDFPKFIRYSVENENLIAKIGDESDTITFKYIKTNE